jgi:hypothetical protein
MAWKHRYSILAILFCAYLLCYVDRMMMASAIPFIAEDFRFLFLSANSSLAHRASGGLKEVPWHNPPGNYHYRVHPLDHVIRSVAEIRGRSRRHR